MRLAKNKLQIFFHFGQKYFAVGNIFVVEGRIFFTYKNGTISIFCEICPYLVETSIDLEISFFFDSIKYPIKCTIKCRKKVSSFFPPFLPSDAENRMLTCFQHVSLDWATYTHTLSWALREEEEEKEEVRSLILINYSQNTVNKSTMVRSFFGAIPQLAEVSDELKTLYVRTTCTGRLAS